MQLSLYAATKAKKDGSKTVNAYGGKLFGAPRPTL